MHQGRGLLMQRQTHPTHRMTKTFWDYFLLSYNRHAIPTRIRVPRLTSETFRCILQGEYACVPWWYLWIIHIPKCGKNLFPIPRKLIQVSWESLKRKPGFGWCFHGILQYSKNRGDAKDAKIKHLWRSAGLEEKGIYINKSLSSDKMICSTIIHKQNTYWITVFDYLRSKKMK